MEAAIRSQIPNIDPVIEGYAAGYLRHASQAYDTEEETGSSPLVEAASAITALLTSASGDFSSTNVITIQSLVQKFVSQLQTSNGTNGERRHLAPTARRLDQTINVGSQRNISTTLGLASGNVDLESANTRKVESRVDKKKLEKAERKIRAKQDKKEMKNVEYETSRLLNQPDEAKSYEEFFMAVNPLQLGSENASKSKDIKVDLSLIHI